MCKIKCLIRYTISPTMTSWMKNAIKSTKLITTENRGITIFDITAVGRFSRNSRPGQNISKTKQSTERIRQDLKDHRISFLEFFQITQN